MVGVGDEKGNVACNEAWRVLVAAQSLGLYPAGDRESWQAFEQVS